MSRIILAASLVVSVFVSHTDASLIGVASTSGVGSTTAVEAVAQTNDDLRNSGTYDISNDYYLLQFATSHILSANYNVEHDGSSGSNITDGNNVSGTISSGTLVHSYLLHHDSNSDGGGTIDSEIIVTFLNPIIGLNGGQTNNTGGSTHEVSFGEFDDVGVTRFGTGAGAGTFDFSSLDIVLNISADRKTLRVRSRVLDDVDNADAFDQLWVVTEGNVIPEPSTYLVFGGLALCFGAAGYWRKRRKAA